MSAQIETEVINYMKKKIPMRYAIIIIIIGILAVHVILDFFFMRHLRDPSISIDQTLDVIAKLQFLGNIAIIGCGIFFAHTIYSNKKIKHIPLKERLKDFNGSFEVEDLEQDEEATPEA